MKKKIILLCLLLTLICGCGSNEMVSLDINKASISLDEKYTSMVSMEENELSAIYSLDTTLMEEHIIKSSSLANGNLYAIIKVSDNNKSKVKDQMNNMFSILEKQSNLYSPEAVKLLQDRLETSVGSYLIYIVGEDTTSLYNIVKEYIS